MNDRFRFRAWDKEEKEIIYEAENTYDYLSNGKGQTIYADSFGDLLDDERYIVEQCTGLKDKNGRLIYEGDIVKTEDNSIYKCVFEMNYGYGIDSPCFMLTNEFGHAQSFDDDIEVVGNIHENTELLEK